MNPLRRNHDLVSVSKMSAMVGGRAANGHRVFELVGLDLAGAEVEVTEENFWGCWGHLMIAGRAVNPPYAQWRRWDGRGVVGRHRRLAGSGHLANTLDLCWGPCQVFWTCRQQKISPKIGPVLYNGRIQTKSGFTLGSCLTLGSVVECDGTAHFFTGQKYWSLGSQINGYFHPWPIGLRKPQLQRCWLC